MKDHADYLHEYMRFSESAGETYLKEIPEWARNFCRVNGKRRRAIREIDERCRRTNRPPVPFVMAKSPRGEFPKWMWDSLKKGHSPEGKKVF